MFSISLINSLYCCGERAERNTKWKIHSKSTHRAWSLQTRRNKNINGFPVVLENAFLFRKTYFGQRIAREEWKRGSREGEKSKICWNSKLLSTAIAYFITSSAAWTAVTLDYADRGYGGLTLHCGWMSLLRQQQAKPKPCFNKTRAYRWCQLHPSQVRRSPWHIRITASDRGCVAWKPNFGERSKRIPQT